MNLVLIENKELKVYRFEMVKVGLLNAYCAGLMW